MEALDGLSEEWWKAEPVDDDTPQTTTTTETETETVNVADVSSETMILEIQHEDEEEQQKGDVSIVNEHPPIIFHDTNKQEELLLPCSPIEFVDSQESNHESNHDTNKEEDEEEEEECLEASEATVPYEDLPAQSPTPPTVYEDEDNNYHHNNTHEEDEEQTMAMIEKEKQKNNEPSSEASATKNGNACNPVSSNNNKEVTFDNDHPSTSTSSQQSVLLTIPNPSDSIDALDASTISAAAAVMVTTSCCTKSSSSDYPPPAVDEELKLAPTVSTTTSFEDKAAADMDVVVSARSRSKRRAEKPRVLSCLLSAEDRRQLKKCVLASLLSEVHEEIILEDATTVNTSSTLLSSSSTTTAAVNKDACSNISRFALKVAECSSIFQTSHVVSGGAEFPNYDGSLIVGRSFRYLFAVAAGLPVFNVTWIQQASHDHALPSSSVSNDGDTDHQYEVAGCVEASQLFAPRRAMETALALTRLRSERNCDGGDNAQIGIHRRRAGAGLLKGYTCFLCGNFDTLQVKSESIRSRGRRRGNASSPKSLSDENVYTRERIVALLQMCSANVFDLDAMNDAMSASRGGSLYSVSLFSDPAKVVVVVKNGATAREFKTAKNHVRTLFSEFDKEEEAIRTFPVVNTSWLLNSIGEFEIQEFDAFTK